VISVIGTGNEGPARRRAVGDAVEPPNGRPVNALVADHLATSGHGSRIPSDALIQDIPVELDLSLESDDRQIGTLEDDCLSLTGKLSRAI
jgi:hypothetical protein